MFGRINYAKISDPRWQGVTFALILDIKGD
jgi:hypothetical protein